MKGLKIFSAVVTTLIAAPIWYYLVYVLLKTANVDRLVWFLYWIYLPVGLLLKVLDTIIWTVDQEKEKK